VTRTEFTLLPEPARADVGIGVVSVDDHVIEPPDTFEGRLPARFADRAPRVVEAPRVTTSLAENFRKWDPDQSPIARGIVDFSAPRQAWSIDGTLYPIYGMDSCVGRPSAEWCMQPLRYDEMRPGSWDIDARVADMDQSGIVASVNFPSLWPSFCGAAFLRPDDVEFGTALTRAWNDWHLDAWAGAYPGRIIPLQLPLLHDPATAAAEVRRNADRGFRAVSFSENPAGQGLASIHSGAWDPFFAACEETDTVLLLHGGSKGSTYDTTPDAPIEVAQCLFPVSGLVAAVDWLWAKVPVRFPGLQIVLPEGGVGWITMVVDWVEHNFRTHNEWTGTWEGDLTPGEVLLRNFWLCALDEPTSVRALGATLGVDRLLLEVDYPHADSSWPRTQDAVEGMLAGLTREQACRVAHASAAELFRWELPAGVACPAAGH
jgi:predicted TIM-barrel fold metal-dependent hydrolase